MTKRQKFFSALGRFFKNIFTKNIPLKIIALLFALLLWGYVLSEVKPKYVKHVDDVKIECTNENRLNDWEVVRISPDKVTVDVEAGIDLHSMLDSSHVKCYVDLGKIKITEQDGDEKTVELDIETVTEYGVLKGTSVEKVEVVIERIKSSKALTADVVTEGVLPEIVTTDGFTEYFELASVGTVTVEPVTGLKSTIDRISSAEVTINLNSFANENLSVIPGKHSKILDVVFRDADGNVIDDPATSGVKVKVDNIEIRRYREVPIVPDVSEDLIDLDRYEYTCGFADGAQKTIRIYGEAEELMKIREIRTETISPESEAGQEKLTVGLVIPSTVKTDQKSTTAVDVSVSQRAEEGREFELPIRYSEPDEGILVTEKPDTIKIKVSGYVEAMEGFSEDWFTADVDLHHYGEGKQELPFTIRFKGVDLHVQNYVVVQPKDGSEPVIRITFVTQDDLTYEIELVKNTVTVTLTAVPEETE